MCISWSKLEWAEGIYCMYTCGSNCYVGPGEYKGTVCTTYQGVKDVCYLSWPIAPSYRSPNAGGGGELRGLSQWVQLYTVTRVQIIFGYLTPYTYAFNTLCLRPSRAHCTHIQNNATLCSAALVLTTRMHLQIYVPVQYDFYPSCCQL